MESPRSALPARFLRLGVGGQLAVDHVGQASAQAAHCFHGGLPFRDPAAVVGAAGGAWRSWKMPTLQSMWLIRRFRARDNR